MIGDVDEPMRTLSRYLPFFGWSVIVTDNRRHFLAALRHGIRAETPAEFIAAEKRRR